jgi:membrane protein implicated in regulation of membrane protease activity
MKNKTNPITKFLALVITATVVSILFGGLIAVVIYKLSQFVKPETSKAIYMFLIYVGVFLQFGLALIERKFRNKELERENEVLRGLLKQKEELK